MPISTLGPLSLDQLAEEFCLTRPIALSSLYLGTDESAVVLSNGGSNALVPSSGRIGLANFRGASCPKNTNTVSLTFQADFSVLSADAALMASFRSDVRTRVADAVGVPEASVTVVDVTAGSVKVAVDVRYPTQGKVAASAVSKLAALSQTTSPSAIFGDEFLSRYSIVGSMAIVDNTPPILVASASMALTGVAGSPASVSIAGLFAAASNTGGGLTYALTTSAAPAGTSISLDSNSGMLTVVGRYRNQSYTVGVNAVSSNGATSSPATVTVTELAAPSPLVASALLTAAPSNATPLTYAMSDYFTTVADTLPLYYWVSANPKSNATVNAAGVLSVPGAYREASYTVLVSASNAYGKSSASSQPLAVTEPAAPPPSWGVSGLGSVTLSNVSKSFDLSGSYAAASDVLPLRYWLATNPYGNATVSDSTLSVTAANRGLSYSVSVAASNAYGVASSSNQTLVVTETAPVSYPATGGTVTEPATNTRRHMFTANSTLVVSASVVCQVLVVGGGGGGGARGGGGGGGEAMYSASTTLAPGSYTVTIGAGGAGGSRNTVSAGQGRGVSGGPTSVGALVTALGGGGGGTEDNGPGFSGGDGGGGGRANPGVGGARVASSFAGFTSYGNAGGTLSYTGTGWAGGSGGGGAGGVGGNAFGNGTAAGERPGNGGAGRAFTFAGSYSITVGGGGGGACGGNAAKGLGGSGGGGDGSSYGGSVGSAGSANTGGGGGSGMATTTTIPNGPTNDGFVGGTGLVIIEYAY